MIYIGNTFLILNNHMTKKLFIVAALLVQILSAHAQSTPTKTILVASILKSQQSGIEAMARATAEQPALMILDRAGGVLASKIAADKRDGIGKDIQSDAQKYLQEAVPLVVASAVKLAPSTIAPLLEERFSEVELKEISIYLESPAIKKYQQVGNEMQQALLAKLLVETNEAIVPKVTALEQTVAKRLGITVPPIAPPASKK